MPIESDADRAGFLAPDEFGSSAVYLPDAGGSASLSGIFDDGDIDRLGESGMAAAVDGMARFLCRAADLPDAAAAGDALSLDSVSYIVRAIRRDGTGMAELQLEADA